ncbi:MAG: acetolactate synthase large subunit [Clostridia bacterium]|nr:acetolactate synthase large subunit [Clostridia bacterium]
MAKYKGAEIIVEFLIKEGVPYALGLCGHGIIGFMDALYTYRDKIKTITPRHEAVAGFMADAYFRIKHKPLVTFTSCGPGSAQIVTAVACAMMDSSAFLAITGNVPTSQFNRGPFQETYRHYQAEFPAVLRPYVKRSFQPTRVDMLPLAVRQAFDVMMTGRWGPVNLDVPLNVFVEEGELGDQINWRRGASNRSQGHPDIVNQALDLLLKAKRPLILAGHGVVLSEASGELRELAHMLNVPVINTPLAKGAIDMRDPLAMGDTGRNGTYAANELARTCDVLLVLGSRLDDRVSSGWIKGYTFNIPPTKLIQVDIDPQEMGRNYPVEIGILGDVKAVLQQMITMIKQRGVAPRPDDDPWLVSGRKYKEEWEAFNEPATRSEIAPCHPARIVSDLQATLPEDAILLTDVGSHTNWVNMFFKGYRPQQVLQSYGWAAMTFSVAGVLGAKLAAPDRPCVAVCGDGGFSMAPHVVSTAVEYNLPVVWIVWNNYGWCSIRDMQIANFKKEIGTSFKKHEEGELFNPDFAALARAMGGGGIRVERPADFRPALVEALESGKPYVLDVVIDREVKPPSTGTWDLPPLPHPEPSYGKRHLIEE